MPSPPSSGALWTGRSLSTLVVLFMLFDTTLHLLLRDPGLRALLLVRDHPAYGS